MIETGHSKDGFIPVSYKRHKVVLTVVPKEVHVPIITENIQKENKNIYHLLGSSNDDEDESKEPSLAGNENGSDNTVKIRRPLKKLKTAAGGIVDDVDFSMRIWFKIP